MGQSRARRVETVAARGYGAVAIANGVVVATDMETYEAESNGIVVFEPDGSARRILEGVDAIDVAVDCDGVVYALPERGRTIHTQHYQGGSVGTIPMDVEVTALAVTPEGDLLVASRDGMLSLLGPDGAPVRSLFVSNMRGAHAERITDVDIAPDGTVVIALTYNDILVTNLRLESVHHHVSIDDPIADVFVAFGYD